MGTRLSRRSKGSRKKRCSGPTECFILCCTGWKSTGGSNPAGGKARPGASANITLLKREERRCCRSSGSSGAQSIQSWLVCGRSSMFDLDHAITEWRGQMTAGGMNNPAELEGHLRDDVE